jgi:serine/threonine protein kinase
MAQPIATLSQIYSRVDVFACGVMLHELLTGEHPIGEVTSDVWPEPKPDKPKAWGHEAKWKKSGRGHLKSFWSPS